jgi:hypothetical protein
VGDPVRVLVSVLVLSVALLLTAVVAFADGEYQ